MSHAANPATFTALLKGSRIDRILLIIALAMIATAWFVVESMAASGPAVAEVYHGQMLLARYELPQRGEPAIHLDIEGEIGQAAIVIDAEGARIAASPCTLQRCVQAGAHRHAGDLIACVPNRILIAIRGGGERGFDAIVE